MTYQELEIDTPKPVLSWAGHDLAQAETKMAKIDTAKDLAKLADLSLPVCLDRWQKIPILSAIPNSKYFTDYSPMIDLG